LFVANSAGSAPVNAPLAIHLRRDVPVPLTRRIAIANAVPPGAPVSVADSAGIPLATLPLSIVPRNALVFAL
jgi:hypothetical protein